MTTIVAFLQHSARSSNPSRLLALAGATCLLLGSCGSSSPEWESTYKDKVQSLADAETTEETVIKCANLGTVTDAEAIQTFALADPAEDTAFEQLMRSLELEPTPADYQRSYQIAVEVHRASCD